MHNVLSRRSRSDFASVLLLIPVALSALDPFPISDIGFLAPSLPPRLTPLAGPFSPTSSLFSVPLLKPARFLKEAALGRCEGLPSMLLPRVTK